MIAFYIVEVSMKTLRNALFVDLTDSIVEKTAVMTRTVIEEKAGLKWCFRGGKLLQWHKAKHKQDDRMIRHPIDVTQ
jgi:hypothetical protein